MRESRTKRLARSMCSPRAVTWPSRPRTLRRRWRSCSRARSRRASSGSVACKTPSRFVEQSLAVAGALDFLGHDVARRRVGFAQVFPCGSEHRFDLMPGVVGALFPRDAEDRTEQMDIEVVGAVHAAALRPAPGQGDETRMRKLEPFISVHAFDGMLRCRWTAPATGLRSQVQCPSSRSST